MQNAAKANMLLGALVADAASLGVHWIYSPARLTEIANRQNGCTAFTLKDPNNYEGVPSYFAHAARSDGDLTQYGTCLKIAIDTMNADGGQFDLASQQAAFAVCFGPGGSYSGYIDRPTRGALANIVDEKSPSGIDDDQLPAVTRLPAVIAAGADAVIDAMQLTNVNDIAAQYTAVFQHVLTEVLGGRDVASALTSAVQIAHEDIQEPLFDALNTSETDSAVYGEKTGSACHLPMAGPLMFQILNHATDFVDAIERNNRAGGDNAGRSILLGAIMAAAHGIDGPTGIPVDWVLRVNGNAHLWSASRNLAGLR